MPRDPSHPSIPSGFTLVELLVVITIISLLVALMLPVLSSARGTSHTIHCATKIRSMGMAYSLFAADYNDGIAPARVGAYRISARLTPRYTGGNHYGLQWERDLLCPSEPRTNFQQGHYAPSRWLTGASGTNDDARLMGSGTWWARKYFHRFSSLTGSPSQVILAADGERTLDQYFNDFTAASISYGRHREAAQFLYADQHVVLRRFGTIEDLEKLEGFNWLGP